MRSKAERRRRSSHAPPAPRRGCGGTNTSGSTRVTWTCAVRTRPQSGRRRAESVGVELGPLVALAHQSPPKYWTGAAAGTCVSTTIMSSACSGAGLLPPTELERRRGPSTQDQPTRSLTIGLHSRALPRNERLDPPACDSRVTSRRGAATRGPDRQQVWRRPRVRDRAGRMQAVSQRSTRPSR